MGWERHRSVQESIKQAKYSNFLDDTLTYVASSDYTINNREIGEDIPSYVSSIAKDNRRKYTNLARVMYKSSNFSLSHHVPTPNFQQQDSEVFSVRNSVEETYDAYEKDIAIALFYFKQPTAFEFTR